MIDKPVCVVTLVKVRIQDLEIELRKDLSPWGKKRALDMLEMNERLLENILKKPLVEMFS